MNQTVILRRALHDELVSHLRDMIVAGELAPGDKIAEAVLCARFGVSRTPLREALKILAAEGLLQLIPNRGAIVARITQEEIDQLFPIIGALEALAGEAACARIDDKGLARIRTMHDQMVRCYKRGDAKAYLRLNRAIHEAIFEVAGNPALSALYQQMLVRTHSVRFVAKKSRARWAEAVADHEEIIAALEARDSARLAAILREHLRHKAGMVEDALAVLDKEPGASRAS